MPPPIIKPNQSVYFLLCTCAYTCLHVSTRVGSGQEQPIPLFLRHVFRYSTYRSPLLTDRNPTFPDSDYKCPLVTRTIVPEIGY